MRIPRGLTAEDKEWLRPHAEMAGDPLPLPYMGTPPSESREYVDEMSILEGWLCRHYLDGQGGYRNRGGYHEDLSRRADQGG